jgi:hypothetical protein
MDPITYAAASPASQGGRDRELSSGAPRFVGQSSRSVTDGVGRTIGMIVRPAGLQLPDYWTATVERRPRTNSPCPR